MTVNFPPELLRKSSYADTQTVKIGLALNPFTDTARTLW